MLCIFDSRTVVLQQQGDRMCDFMLPRCFVREESISGCGWCSRAADMQARKFCQVSPKWVMLGLRQGGMWLLSLGYPVG